VGVRRALTTATAVVSCSAAAALCAAPAQAAAHGGGQGWCDFGTLSYAPNGQPPVVTTTNATALSSGRLTNEAWYNLVDIHAVLSVAPPSGTSIPGGAGAPLLAWRVDGRAWQTVSLTWNGLSGPGAAWRSQDLDLGFDLVQGGQAGVDLEAEFAAASPGGQYVEQLTFTAQTCGSQILGAGLNFADYGPAAQRSTPTPARTTASAPADRPTAQASHSPTPSATPTAPPPKPSPSPSPLKINFVQVLPSAQPAASTETGGGSRVPDGVLVVVAVVFLGGLVCIRAVRRRDSS
jgi:hypothetical protein